MGGASANVGGHGTPPRRGRPPPVRTSSTTDEGLGSAPEVVEPGRRPASYAAPPSVEPSTPTDSTYSPQPSPSPIVPEPSPGSLKKATWNRTDRQLIPSTRDKPLDLNAAEFLPVWGGGVGMEGKWRIS